MAVEKENNCAARVLSVHDRGLRRRHIEERRQLQRWKDGDVRTTFMVMAETQKGFYGPTVCVIAG